MNPELTISILAVLLLVNSIAMLVYWFRLRAAKSLAETVEQYSDKWYQLALQQTDKINEWRKACAELQSKINASKEALKREQNDIDTINRLDRKP